MCAKGRESKMANGENELRKRVETRLASASEDLSASFPRDSRALIHELRTHQIELEMRNEELRRAEEELEKHETRYRTFFKETMDVYYRTDMDGYINAISPSCLAQTGYAQEEILDRPVTEFYTDPAQREKLLDKLLQKGQVNDFEVQLVHKDGSSRIASVSCYLTLDEGGQPIAVEGILRDITKRKQEEERRNLLLGENRDLIRRLMQVQEEERRLLARTLHDELGQLLTCIDTRAAYIARHTDDAELRTMAEEIVRDISTSFDASHAMLLKLRPGSLDILGLAAALTELVGQWEKLADMDCSLHIGGDIDHLDDMHAIAIYRLVQEGLTNAHRHGKAHRVGIIVRNTPPHAGRPGCVLVEISDNGKGLRVEAHEGMGIIGMRERVRALGGTFLLSDHPRDGVRIEAMLPLNEGKDEGKDS